MPKQRLALSWGPSFAELENGQEWLRVYTAQTPIPQLLKNTATSLDPAKSELRASLSVMRRILDTRLGNSVAQIVTKGFEHWVLLRQEADPGRFDLSPSRGEPLSNPEHIFGISERVSADGKIQQAVQIKELEKISETLKARQIERVCVNLMFAHRNSEHQNMVASYFRERGFQVFARARSKDSSDELSAWRRNLLDASLSSFFEKIQTEISEALPNATVEYLDTEKGFVPAGEVSTSALLFGREAALQGTKPFLYFGPEEWGWILPESRPSWKSPWGQVELSSPQIGFFSIQPGRELLLTQEGRVKWGNDPGMDPGPMLWGRSSKITLLDVMNWHWETTPPLRRTEKTEAKVNEQLDALKRNSRDWGKAGIEKIRKDVTEQLLESFLNDLASHVNSDEFEVAGVLGPQLLPLLQKARPKWRWSARTDFANETSSFWRKNRA